MKVKDRFFQYVSFDTQSDHSGEGYPSTSKQLELARFLVGELKALGLEDAGMDSHGYVTATLPGNTPGPVLGLLAHMDTSPDLSGRDVKPRVIPGYDGGVVELSPGLVMDPVQFEGLSHYIGQDLIVADGSTLLGADDKAGIAEIITMAEYLLAHPEIKHGTIRLAFTPDEEVGRGTDYFDLKAFGADFAYTVDGSLLGELEYENFNAASAVVTVQGASIHPGSAKNKMINAILVAMEFQGMLPVHQVPEATEGYEGFLHLCEITGDIDRTVLQYIVRDHDWDLLCKKLDLLKKAALYLNEKFGSGTVTVESKESYRNMKEKLLPDYVFLLDNARAAMERVGVQPIVRPIRGGTDGARLSWEGLPCPNLCTGGQYFHGRYECISVQAMEKVVEILIELAKISVGE